MNKDDELMIKEDMLVDKQVNLFSNEISQTIQRLTMRCNELDGRTDTSAITISLSRVFAASAAALTKGMSEDLTKNILHELYEMIEDAVFYYKKDLEENADHTN